MKKAFSYLVLIVGIVGISGLFLQTNADSRDLLKKSYEKVFDYDYATDKEADDLFEGGVQIG